MVAEKSYEEYIPRVRMIHIIVSEARQSLPLRFFYFLLKISTFFDLSQGACSGY